jgi:Zn-dependent protease
MEVFLFVTVGWVFSVCLHEFGHALVAFRGGDYTVKDKGYLTLNPIHYAHPVYSLLMPLLFLLLGGIGLPGGAVYINDHLLRSKKWRSMVSIAGPFMNVALIWIMCLPFWFGALEHPRAATLACGLAFLIQLEICAVLFNLLPVPPLDGFQALAPWLPARITIPMTANSNALLWGIVLILWYVPAANHGFWTAVNTMTSLLGVSPDLAREGWDQFRFWSRDF